MPRQDTRELNLHLNHRIVWTLMIESLRLFILLIHFNFEIPQVFLVVTNVSFFTNHMSAGKLSYYTLDTLLESLSIQHYQNAHSWYIISITFFIIVHFFDNIFMIQSLHLLLFSSLASKLSLVSFWYNFFERRGLYVNDSCSHAPPIRNKWQIFMVHSHPFITYVFWCNIFSQLVSIRVRCCLSCSRIERKPN